MVRLGVLNDPCKINMEILECDVCNNTAKYILVNLETRKTIYLCENHRDASDLAQ